MIALVLLLLISATSAELAYAQAAPDLSQVDVQPLLTKGTADSLAAAAVLSQFGEETDHGAYTMIARAVALAPGRRDLAWLAVRLCGSAADCDPARPEEHLRSVDPDNGVAFLGPLARAQAKNDPAAIDAALTAIAGSKRFHVYFSPLVVATAPQLAAARHRGSGEPTRKEMARATVEMIGVIAASVLPPSQSFSFSCRGLALQQVTGRLERCQQAAQAFERADTFIVEGLGLSLQNRLWAPESTQGYAITQRRRVFQYRLEEYSRLNISSSKLDEIPPDLLDVLRTHEREQDTALVYFARANIPVNPPPDWTSTQLPRVP